MAILRPPIEPAPKRPQTWRQAQEKKPVSPVPKAGKRVRCWSECTGSKWSRRRLGAKSARATNHQRFQAVIRSGHKGVLLPETTISLEQMRPRLIEECRSLHAGE